MRWDMAFDESETSMTTSRRGFLMLLSSAIATPVIAKLSMDSGLILPPGVEAVEVIEPQIVTSGAASFARAQRIFCMPGMIGQLAEHVRAAAMSALPPGAHFQVRAVPMNGEDRDRAGVRRNSKNGVALIWVSESDVTPMDREYKLVGRFMVPSKDEESDDMKLARARLEAYADLEKVTGAQDVPKPKEVSSFDFLQWLRGKA